MDRLSLHLKQSRLIRPGDAVLVALSGGADSTILLHLLRFGVRHWRLRLRAAHLDHGMRSGSAADALWVRGLALAWEVPLVHSRVERAPTSEAEAREARYAFLHRVAAADERIATAHHLDDQAETVIFRAIRGTGIRGLRGIADRRGPVIRPLLPFTRDELVAYGRLVRLDWRDDPTNLDPRFARNRIRHRVLPLLELERPGAARSLAALAKQARLAEAAWQSILPRLEREAVVSRDRMSATLARDVLHSYHPGVRARLLRHILRRYGSMPGRAGTHAALKFINSGPSGGEVHLPGGVRIERDFDRIRLTRVGASATADTAVEIPGPGAGCVRGTIGGRAIEVRWGREAARVATDRVSVPEWARFPLVFRQWEPGDRIRLAYGSKKLKKLFAEQRLDRRSRRSTPILADAGGRVLWVVGIARAAGVGEAGGALDIAVKYAE